VGNRDETERRVVGFKIPCEANACSTMEIHLYLEMDGNGNWGGPGLKEFKLT